MTLDSSGVSRTDMPSTRALPSGTFGLPILFITAIVERILFPYYNNVNNHYSPEIPQPPDRFESSISRVPPCSPRFAPPRRPPSLPDRRPSPLPASNRTCPVAFRVAFARFLPWRLSACCPTPPFPAQPPAASSPKRGRRTRKRCFLTDPAHYQLTPFHPGPCVLG